MIGPVAEADPMQCVILAAGYATRLYPLTKDRPKPLLPVAGVSILDRLMKKIDRTPAIEHVVIVSNERFIGHFSAWRNSLAGGAAVTVLSDGTSSNEDRLGAVGDIRFAVRELGIDDDLLVLAGDNLFDFELADFVSFFRRKEADCITCHRLLDRSRLQRTGVIEVDQTWQVTGFQEKPEAPRSDLAVPPFYLYRRKTLSLISEYLDAGGAGDAPGSFIPWLLENKPVFAYFFEGERYDIGNLESYREADRLFASR